MEDVKFGAWPAKGDEVTFFFFFSQLGFLQWNIAAFGSAGERQHYCLPDNTWPLNSKRITSQNDLANQTLSLSCTQGGAMKVKDALTPQTQH